MYHFAVWKPTGHPEENLPKYAPIKHRAAYKQPSPGKDLSGSVIIVALELTLEDQPDEMTEPRLAKPSSSWR